MATNRRGSARTGTERDARAGGWSAGRIGGVAAVVVTLAGLAVLLVQSRGPSPPPDIVLLVVDTLRADHLGCLGYPRDTSPNVDRLAADGVLFTNAISQAPWTLPSVASLLTSQYPSVLGIRGAPTVIRPGFRFLAHELKEQGYQTHGIVSHDMVSSRLGFAAGFDVYDESHVLGHSGSSAAAVTDSAVAFLKRDHDRPFFLFVHYFDPHYDYLLHEQYDYFPDYAGSIASGESILSLWAKRHAMSAADIAYLNALYDSEVAFTDQHIGRLLDTLRGAGLYDDALIVLTADHGEELMERGWIGHTITLFQELIRVPLMVKLPGGSAGVVEAPVGLVDVMPTILRSAGLVVPEGLEGLPLVVEAPQEIASRPVFSETFNPQVHRLEPVTPVALSCIVLGRDKVIVDLVRGRFRAYDLRHDAGERADLSRSPYETPETLLRLLREWRIAVDDKAKQAPAAHQGAAQQEVFSPEQVERLKALGYL